ncbi:MFS transporter [Mucilaginibacter achroorhodeus]|uniref:MFS transporter n=1 Tax=Mucilaginibacter achroorhodeus TaxID=2599294 RepID=A0A563U6T4_9SPHI|nr:MFS transporter [Mucilaginibacter achroorhodeus]TWR27045.1 MFS transporter [Mucilaginibacter achroorhodeus]
MLRKLPVLKESARLRYFTFLYLYIMQGIPSGFALTAVANYLTGKGLSSQSVGTFVAIVGIPWIIQFIWGPIIDRYQFSVIGHRKQWIVLTQFMAFIASLSLLFIHDPVKQLGMVSLAFFIHSNFASVQDASVDAMAISIVPESERGRVNAFMRGGYLLGIALGSAGLSTILYHSGFFYAALTQSGLLLVFTIITYLIKLDQADSYIPAFNIRNKARVVKEKLNNPQLKWLFKQLYIGIITPKSLRTFGVIALVYTCNSVFIRSYSYHLIHTLHWQYNSVSVLQGGWGTLATLLVTLGGGVLADRIGAPKLQTKVMLAICLFLIVFNCMGGLWLHKSLSVSGLILWNFADPMFSVAAMPVLMALCRDKVEGSQFTAYMALVNFCDVMGAYISGWAMTYVGAPVIGATCGALVLLVLILRYINRPTVEPMLLKPQLDV